MIELLITLIIVGIALGLIFKYAGIPEPIRAIIIIVIVLFFCVWLLNVFGLINIPMRR